MIRTIPPAAVYGLFVAAAVAARSRSGVCGCWGSIRRLMPQIVASFKCAGGTSCECPCRRTMGFHPHGRALASK